MEGMLHAETNKLTEERRRALRTIQTPRGFIACHTVGLICSASGGPNVIDPIEASFVNYIRPQLGPNSKNCQIHESSGMSSRVKPV